MEPTYNLVHKAFEPIYEWAKTLSFEERNEYSQEPFDRTINLRLDAETIAAPHSTEQTLWPAFVQFRDDVLDLITNGDVSQNSDALLKYFDGEVKRGKPLKRLHIPKATLFREFRPTRNSYEYTLYIVIYVEFE